MNLSEISNYRLINQKIAGSEFYSAKELISWMGAMQAQDFAMAKWALGLRFLNSTEDAIEFAINKAEIVRTHVLRPTWHFVAAEDIRWMLELTAPRIKSSLKSRHKALEITETVHAKSEKIILNALSEGKSLTREELSAEFAKAKISTNENRLSHMLLSAELNGLICSGPMKARKTTYALLADRVPGKNNFTRDESLAELAKRYFSSHGPATLPDFAWWSGLSATDARKALDFIKPHLISIKTGAKEYWHTATPINIDNKKTGIHLLPAYDEFLISYTDRSEALALTDNKKVISDNGIFRPVITINGQVTGIWKATRKDETIRIEINFLHAQTRAVKEAIEELACVLGRFYNKTSKVTFNK
jgi:hypothetical protein